MGPKKRGGKKVVEGTSNAATWGVKILSNKAPMVWEKGLKSRLEVKCPGASSASSLLRRELLYGMRMKTFM